MKCLFLSSFYMSVYTYPFGVQLCLYYHVIFVVFYLFMSYSFELGGSIPFRPVLTWLHMKHGKNPLQHPPRRQYVPPLSCFVLLYLLIFYFGRNMLAEHENRVHSCGGASRVALNLQGPGFL